MMVNEEGGASAGIGMGRRGGEEEGGSFVDLPVVVVSMTKSSFFFFLSFFLSLVPLCLYPSFPFIGNTLFSWSLVQFIDLLQTEPEEGAARERERL